jgi:hypothetical protein
MDEISERMRGAPPFDIEEEIHKIRDEAGD